MKLVIAEVGSVHDGSFGNALNLVSLAKRSGADVVKFQTHFAEEESAIDAPSPKYFSKEDRFNYFLRTEFSKNQWMELSQYCVENDIVFSSSVFSFKAVDVLIDSGVRIIKIPSGEVTNTPLLKYVASTGLPIILSSGMSNWNELDSAVEIFSRSELTILQCTSKYPCPIESVGLNVLRELGERYRRPVGFSDHTQTESASIAAATIGASVIEKHLTFSRDMYGSDAKFASTPEEFMRISTGVKDVWKMLSNPVDKDNINFYHDMKLVFQKSVAVRCDLTSGHELLHKDLTLLKPGSGISPSELESVVGRILKRDKLSGEILLHEDLI